MNDLEKIKSVSFSEIKKDEKLTFLLLKVYSDLYDCKNPKFCVRSLEKYYKLVVKLNIDKMKAEKTCKLKEGILLYDAANITHYSNANITDEIAHKLIEKNPLLKDKFEKLPEEKPKKKKSVKKES